VSGPNYPLVLVISDVMCGTWIILACHLNESTNVANRDHPKSMFSHSIGGEIERANAFIIIDDRRENETVNHSIAILLWLQAYPGPFRQIIVPIEAMPIQPIGNFSFQRKSNARQASCIPTHRKLPRFPKLSHGVSGHKSEALELNELSFAFV
jgi:hypothetical protein